MKIINLIEDTQGRKDLHYEHGLSFYIRTENHSVLLDTGASGDFVENAIKLGIDLREIDTLILSHGHYDHTGGVMRFARINPTAKIYLHALAGGEYFNDYNSQHKYIGIDKDILNLPGLIPVDGNMKIDGELFIFSSVNCTRPIPAGNSILKQEVNGCLVQDSFLHEQYLAVKSGGKTALLSGCAHRGILNILDAYKDLFGSMPDYCISGFHMMKKTPYCADDILLAEQTAHELLLTGTTFFSGHCTGEEALTILKNIMGDKLKVICSGDTVIG